MGNKADETENRLSKRIAELKQSDQQRPRWSTFILITFIGAFPLILLAYAAFQIVNPVVTSIYEFVVGEDNTEQE